MLRRTSFAAAEGSLATRFQLVQQKPDALQQKEGKDINTFVEKGYQGRAPRRYLDIDLSFGQVSLRAKCAEGSHRPDDPIFSIKPCCVITRDPTALYHGCVSSRTTYHKHTATSLVGSYGVDRITYRRTL